MRLNDLLGWLIVTFTIVILSIGMFRGGASYSEYVALRKSFQVLDEVVQGLENQNRDLRIEIDKIKSSKDYAEKILRDKYHVTKEGESVVFYGQ